ncbi:MAG TPA: cell division protein FtsB [Gammaproteobacteria bacterium]|nr:cell division protein FtsB [Gammaproteobacteria bacterium]
MRIVVFLLLILLGALQIRLWHGEGSWPTVWALRDQIKAQRLDNDKLKERNQALEAEVQDLKQGLEAIEERARSEMGMIKKDEVFYQIIDQPGVVMPAPAGSKPSPPGPKNSTGQ